MPGYDRKPRADFSFDDVEIGPADAACIDLDCNFSRGREGIGEL